MLISFAFEQINREISRKNAGRASLMMENGIMFQQKRKATAGMRGHHITAYGVLTDGQ